jgi:hypothetical protein
VDVVFTELREAALGGHLYHACGTEDVRIAEGAGRQIVGNDTSATGQSGCGPLFGFEL